MLQIDDLHTYYGDSHTLRGVALELPAGTSLGLLGRNGMGKTTLIRALIGYVPAAKGRVRWRASAARHPTAAGRRARAVRKGAGRWRAPARSTNRAGRRHQRAPTSAGSRAPTGWGRCRGPPARSQCRAAPSARAAGRSRPGHPIAPARRPRAHSPSAYGSASSCPCRCGRAGRPPCWRGCAGARRAGCGFRRSRSRGRSQ